MIRVVARPFFFSQQTYVCDTEAGPSIAELLGCVRDDVTVTINGDVVPSGQWPDVRPIDGDLIAAVTIPQGPAKIALIAIAQAIASAASAAAAAVGSALGAIGGALGGGLGGAIASAVGLTGGWASLVGAVINVGLAVAPSMLIKPQTPSLPSASIGTSRYFTLTGGQNQAARFEPIPRLYGTLRITPPLGGNYYTVIEGNKQYMQGLLCLGYGPLLIGGFIVGKNHNGTQNAVRRGSIGKTAEPGFTSVLPADTIRIGETDINSYKGIDWELGDPSQISLYTNDIAEQSFSITLNQGNGDGSTIGYPSGWIPENATIQAVRSTDDNTSEFSIDIAYPVGLFNAGKDGRKQSSGVRWRVDIRPFGGTTWTVLQGTLEHAGAGSKPIRKTRTYKAADLSAVGMTTPGRFDIRLTRISTLIDDWEMRGNDAVWAALRSIRRVSPWEFDPAKGGIDGVVMLAIRIKASGQLNGNVDPISVLAQSVLPVWNGSAWVEQATNNPAWAYCDALKGRQVSSPISDAQLNRTAIQTWANACAASGTTYNWLHADQETILDRIRAISSTGRAAWAMPDGKFSVVRDDQFTPIQVITPRNSKSFELDLTYPKIPHALRVRYIDPTTWEQVERIVLDDGYQIDGKNAFGVASPGLPVATRFEILETQGVTDPNQAWREGRYYLAAARLRPETYTVEMDFENLVVTRGDCVSVSFDTMVTGLSWGRIRSRSTNAGGQTTAMVMDEQITMEAGKSYAMRIRKQDGTQVVQGITTVAGDFTSATFSAPVTGLNDGDLWIFGESGIESILAKVLEIDYLPDLAARLKLIPAAPGILTADTGAIPAYNPGINKPPDMIQPLPPVIEAVTASGPGAYLDNLGNRLQDVQVMFRPGPSSVQISLVEIIYHEADGLGNVTDDESVTATNEQTNVILRGIVEGSILTIRARAQSIYGRWSVNSVDTVYTVTPAKRLIPAAPTGLVITPNATLVQGGVVDSWFRVSWTPAVSTATLPVDHYELEWKKNTDLIYTSTSPGGAATSFDIKGLVVGQAYDVRIRSVTNTSDVSAWLAGTGTAANAVPSVTAPTGLGVSSGGPGIIKLTWDVPTFTGYIKTEIWRNPNNNLGTATKVGETAAATFLDTVTTTATYYYWIRHIGIGFVAGPYNAGTTGGTPASAASATYLLSLLTDQLSESQLINSLKTRLNKIEINETAISTEQTTRQNADNALASSITAITASTAGFDPALTYYFDVNAEGWTGVNNTLTWSAGTIQITNPTVADNFIRSPTSLAINGAKNPTVKVKVKRLSGSSWEGNLYFDTSGHGESSSFYKNIPNPNIAIGQSAILEFDMTTLTVGGGDWISSTITRFRLDFSQTTTDTWEIDWIAVGRNAPAASSAALIAEQSARASGDSANASSITTLTSRLNNAGGSGITLEQNISTTASQVGGLQASYTVKIDNNGYVTGFGLASVANNGTTIGEFAIVADKFSIAPVATSATANDGSPFFHLTASQIINGVTVPPGTYMKTAYIADGTIENAKIGNVIQSTSYIPNTSGWRLDKSSNLEINGGLLSVRDASGALMFSANGSHSPFNTGNTLVNPTFELAVGGAEFAGWGKVLGANTVLGADLVGWTLAGGRTGYIWQQDAATGAQSYLFGSKMAVTPGQTVEFTVYTGAHRCEVGANLECYNASGVYNGNTITSANGTSHRNVAQSAGGGILSDFKRVWAKGTVPAGTAYVRPVLYKSGTLAGNSDSWAFFSNAYCGTANPYQAAPNDFSAPVSLIPDVYVKTLHIGDGDVSRFYNARNSSPGNYQFFGVAALLSPITGCLVALPADPYRTRTVVLFDFWPVKSSTVGTFDWHLALELSLDNVNWTTQGNWYIRNPQCQFGDQDITFEWSFSGGTALPTSQLWLRWSARHADGASRPIRGFDFSVIDFKR